METERKPQTSTKFKMTLPKIKKILLPWPQMATWLN